MKPGPALVVMAAGIGSRYGGLKQMEAVGPAGEFIIDYSVYDALRAGFERLVFVVRQELEDEFRARVGRRVEGHADTCYVLQGLDDVPAGVDVPVGRQKPWGTAHAVLCCQSEVDSPFAVINADDYYGRSTFRDLRVFLDTTRDSARRHHYGMIGYRIENTLTDHGHVARGVCLVDDDQNLIAIDERLRVERHSGEIRSSQDGLEWVTVPCGTIVSMNMWGFSPAIFPELETRFHQFLGRADQDLASAEFYLPVAVGALVSEGKAQIKVLSTEEQWFGVTYRQDLLRVRRSLSERIALGQYPADLWQK